MAKLITVAFVVEDYLSEEDQTDEIKRVMYNAGLKLMYRPSTETLHDYAGERIGSVTVTEL